jgi:hypothetical protein
VAKVGTSNPDRTISLKSCSTQLKTNMYIFNLNFYKFECSTSRPGSFKLRNSVASTNLIGECVYLKRGYEQLRKKKIPTYKEDHAQNSGQS